MSEIPTYRRRVRFARVSVRLTSGKTSSTSRMASGERCNTVLGTV